MKPPAYLPSSLCARFPAFRERARLAAAAGRPGLDWGLPSLNALLGGAQGMGIVGGIAGARKTTFLQHLGWGVVLNNDAFFAHFSFEMPPEAIDSYAVAHLAGVEKCKALGPLFDDAELDEERTALETPSSSLVAAVTRSALPKQSPWRICVKSWKSCAQRRSDHFRERIGRSSLDGAHARREAADELHPPLASVPRKLGSRPP